MLITIPMQSEKAVLLSISATATDIAKRDLYRAIKAKYKIKSLRGADPKLRARVEGEFARAWKAKKRELKKARPKQARVLTPNQKAYNDHFRETVKSFGVNHFKELSQEQRKAAMKKAGETWRAKKAA